MKRRDDDFQSRRGHLAGMSDEQLKDYFWETAAKVTAPLLQLGYENTSPSIERSVLLRMGFSSLEVKPIVDAAMARNLLGHGAGNIVYRYAKEKNLPIREAGLQLANGEGWDEAAALFGKGGVGA